jgi:predicted phosphohydrolase
MTGVFAIADPHLSARDPKPMSVFGPAWEAHPDVFFERWHATVGPSDLVLVPGDISWAMRLEAAMDDLQAIAELPGRKVLLRGNHDYWWPSIGKLRAALPAGMHAVQNDAVRVDGVVVAGTRGWVCPGSHGFGEQDEKIYRRELERLKMSLSAAEALRTPSDRVVVMTHFPPTNAQLEPSEMTAMIEAYAPDAYLFGHVHHGADRVISSLPGVPVHFVAADALDFWPAFIFDV